MCASFFRFAGGYSLGYWAKSYFSGVYPDKEDAYAEFYFLILLFGGMPSELIGGYICDKYEPAIPGIKGYVSAGGAFLGAICIVFTFMIKSNFEIQMVMYYFEYLFAECFFGPSYAQINKLISSQMQGLAVAIFMITGATAGSFFTAMLGVMGDKYEIDKHPQRMGYIMGTAVLISYLGCIPFFLMNAKEYAQNIRYQRIITAYVAKNTNR